MNISNNCKYCGNIFIAKRLSTKYCCKKCNDIDYKKKKRVNQILEFTNSIKQKKTKLLNDNNKSLINNKEYLNIKELCFLLGISRSSIYRLINNKKLTISKVGGKVIISREEIKFLCSHENIIKIPEEVNELRKAFNINNCYYIGEIQNSYGISSSTLYNQLAKNNIEKVQIGNYVYILKSDIERIFGKNKKNEWLT